MHLPYTPPYDFAGLLAFYRTRAVPGVEHVDETIYSRTLPGGGTVHVRAAPAVDGDAADALDVTLRGVAAGARRDALARVHRMFNLDADPEELRRAFRGDPLMASCIRRHPGLRIPGAWDGFELAVRAILGQQVSVAAARTLAARLVQRFGTPLATKHAGLDAAWPAPERLADADVAAIGLPASRARAVNALARATADGAVSFTPGQEPEAFIADLVALPGIGRWTAEYTAMRALGDRDAFPAGDLVLQRVAAEGGERLTERATRARAEAWRPYRAYTVLHLWRRSTES